MFAYNNRSQAIILLTQMRYILIHGFNFVYLESRAEVFAIILLTQIRSNDLYVCLESQAEVFVFAYNNRSLSGDLQSEARMVFWLDDHWEKYESN